MFTCHYIGDQVVYKDKVQEILLRIVNHLKKNVDFVQIMDRVCRL